MNKLLSLVKSYFPSKLPAGMTAFEEWARDIVELVGPIADPNSLKWALASQVIHLDHKTGSIPKQYFVRCLRKAAANQVASQVIQDIKTAQAEAAKQAAEAAAKEVKSAEDTANKEAVSNVPEVL